MLGNSGESILTVQRSKPNTCMIKLPCSKGLCTPNIKAVALRLLACSAARVQLPPSAAAKMSAAAVPASTKRTVVIYHYPCADGIYSALAAALHFRQSAALPGAPRKRDESLPVSEALVRFVPLTVFKKHTVDELQLQVSARRGRKQDAGLRTPRHGAYGITCRACDQNVADACAVAQRSCMQQQKHKHARMHAASSLHACMHACMQGDEGVYLFLHG